MQILRASKPLILQASKLPILQTSILITGHTGFKGSWLALWLKKIGAEVIGLSLPPDTKPNLYEEAKVIELIDRDYKIDLARAENIPKLIQIFTKHKPEIVFHLAAQSLVRRSYREPVWTWASNVMGTVHLLEAIRLTKTAKVVIVVTTDKVYRNKSWIYPYRETDELGGKDPYSASKGATEFAAASYRDSFFREKGIALATVRAGNVIGGGDWAEDRLIPDAVRAWSKGESLIVRNPDHVRPWQHVLEPLWGYMLLAMRLIENPDIAGSYNFGPEPNEVFSVREVIERSRKIWNDKAEVIWGEGQRGPHEEKLLTLDISKAREVLGYVPKWRFDIGLERTINWYKNFYSGKHARELCFRDIDEREKS